MHFEGNMMYNLEITLKNNLILLYHSA